MGLFNRNKINKVKKARIICTLEHINGLEIPEGLSCKMTLYEDKLLIEPAGFEYNLNIDRIKSVDFKMDIDIKQYTKSSLTKGLVGGLTLGAVGAIVGSSPKTKEKREVKGYTIINYINANNESTYLILRDIYINSGEAAKFTDELRKLITTTNSTKIDL